MVNNSPEELPCSDGVASDGASSPLALSFASVMERLRQKTEPRGLKSIAPGFLPKEDEEAYERKLEAQIAEYGESYKTTKVKPVSPQDQNITGNVSML